MKEKSEIKRLQLDFIDHLEEELERSPKTLENYNRYIHQFIIFTNIKTPKDIDEELVDLYKKWLKNRRIRRNKHDNEGETMNEKTQNYYLIALRAFLKYLQGENITSLDPKYVTLIEHERNAPEYLEDETIETIIESFTRNDIKSLRDKAIFLTLLTTGARVSELCALNKKDVRENMIILTGKKGVKRKLPLIPLTGDAIHTYIQSRKDNDEALFVNNGKRVSLDNSIRLTPRSVQRIVQQCALLAGVDENISPHILRHTFAHALFIEGKSREDIRILLGYEDILSSHIYK